jgi:transposase
MFPLGSCPNISQSRLTNAPRSLPNRGRKSSRRRAAGESLVALAAEYGISRQRVDIIAKRQKPTPTRRPQLSRLSAEQQEWLKSKITQSKRAWKLTAIEKLVFKQFGIHLETAAYLNWLVDLGVRIGDYDENMPLSPEFEAYLRSEEARKLREREAIWQASQPAYKPRRGRPRKNPIAPPPPTKPVLSPDAPLEDDDDLFEEDEHEENDAIESLSLEEMLASVEATRKKTSGSRSARPSRLRLGTKAQCQRPRAATRETCQGLPAPQKEKETEKTLIRSYPQGRS